MTINAFKDHQLTQLAQEFAAPELESAPAAKIL
jgi:hypothetical protein